MESESRPLMLKDFLRDDPSSSSSNASRALARQSGTEAMSRLLEVDLNCRAAFGERRISRIRSKVSLMSAFQKASAAVINAIRHLPSYSVKSDSKKGILTRSLSRTLQLSFRRESKEEKHQMSARVIVRDIISSKSFRCEEDEEMHLASSISDSDSSSSSKGSSSWAESDFTLYSDGSMETNGKRQLPYKIGGVGGVSVKSSTWYGESKIKHFDKKEERGETKTKYAEEQHQSPVSVLEFPYKDYQSEVPSPSFEDRLIDMDSTVREEALAKKITSLEERTIKSEIEEEATELTLGLEEDGAIHLVRLLEARCGKGHTHIADALLPDFFCEGLSAQRRRSLSRQAVAETVVLEDLLRAASEWVNGCSELELEAEDNRAACVKEMVRDEKWMLEAEEGEVAMEVEIRVVTLLVDELLLDLLG